MEKHTQHHSTSHYSTWDTWKNIAQFTTAKPLMFTCTLFNDFAKWTEVQN